MPLKADLSLGKLAVAMEQLSEAQLQSALQEKRALESTGDARPFGDYLVDEGLLPAEALADLTNLLRRRSAIQAVELFGEQLLRQGATSKAALQAARGNFVREAAVGEPQPELLLDYLLGAGGLEPELRRPLGEQLGPTVALFTQVVGYGPERPAGLGHEASVLRIAFQRGALSEPQVLRAAWLFQERAGTPIEQILVGEQMLDATRVARISGHVRPARSAAVSARSEATEISIDDLPEATIEQEPEPSELPPAAPRVERRAPRRRSQPDLPRPSGKTRRVGSDDRARSSARLRRASSDEPPRPAARSRRASGGRMQRATEGRMRTPSSGRMRRSSTQLSSAGGNPALLWGTVGGGALLLLISLAVFLTRGAPEDPRPRKRPAASSSAKKKPQDGSEREDDGPAGPPSKQGAGDKFAGLFQRTEKTVKAALARGDLKAAADAVADFRFALVGRRGAQPWLEKAHQLQQQIQRRSGAQVAAARKRFDALLEAEKFDEAEALLTRLQKVASAGQSDRLEQMEQALMTARFVADQRKANPTPVGPKPKPRPKIDRTAQLTRRRGRLAEARKKLASERREHTRLLAQRTARVLRQTESSPIRMTVAGVDLGPCQITEYTDRGIALKGAQVSLRAAWNQLSRDQVYQIRKRALSDQDAQGWYDLGRYMALRKAFRTAERCFAKAVEGDPTFERRIPDLKRLKERPRPFKAEYQRIGADVLRVNWDFKNPDQAKDFEFEGKVKLSVGGGKLRLSGTGTCFVSLKQEIKFERQVAIRASGMDGTGDTMIGLRFFLKDRYLTLLVMRDPKDGQLGLYRETQDRFVPHVKTGFRYDSRKPVALVMDNGQLALYSGRKKLWSGVEGSFTDCWPVIGFFSDKKSPVTSLFSRLEVEGRVPPKWFARSALEEEARLFRALEYDLKLTDIRQAETIPELPLDQLPQLSGSARAAFEAGLSAMRQAFREKNMVKLIVGGRLMSQAASMQPDHPGVLFYLGFALERVGRRDEALEAYQAAASSMPELVAVQLKLAGLLPNLFRYEAAEAAVAKVLALEPDNARGYLARGLIRFYKTSSEEALDDLELARVLAPKNVEVRKAIKDVRHVLAGPSFSPQLKKTRRTTHYRIITDLDSKTLRLFSEHLEAIHAHYTAFFEPQRLPQRRSQVLLFRTREAYQTYAELTTNDRAESTLGYYHPHYQQLLLFEGLDRKETLWVMYHEAFHQYVHQLIPLIPIWLNEGMAEYFGASEVKRGKVIRTGLVQEGRLNSLKAGIKMGFTPPPFKRVMLMSQAEFYGPAASLLYAQAWSMVHFFFNRADFKPILIDYLNALRAGKTNKQAFAASFAKMDLDQAYKDWRAYVDALK